MVRNRKEYCTVIPITIKLRNGKRMEEILAEIKAVKEIVGEPRVMIEPPLSSNN